MSVQLRWFITAAVTAGALALFLPSGWTAPHIALAGDIDDSGKLHAALDEKIALLSNVVIHEKISRYSEASNSVHKLDTLDTDVEVVDGAERYSDIRRNSQAVADADQIPGAWSFGEVVTLLRTTDDALDQNVFDNRSYVVENSVPLVRMEFHYPAQSHKWFVNVASKIYWLDFEGTLWVSPHTGDIVRVSWESTSPPPAETGVASVLWTVGFRSTELAGKICTLPDSGIYRVNHSVGDGWSEWNVTRFSGIGRYGSRVRLRFD